MTAVGSWFRDLPVARKLITIGLATTATAVLGACVAILAYDVASSRARLAHEVAVLADIIGANSTAAVASGDAAAAAEILGAVAANTHIISAAIRLADGSVFARYGQAGSPGALSAAAEPVVASPAWHWTTNGRLVLARPISRDGDVIGSVVITSDIKEIEVRAAQFGAMVFCVLAGAVGIAFAVTVRLQRAISMPLLRLIAATLERLGTERRVESAPAALLHVVAQAVLAMDVLRRWTSVLTETS